VALTDLMQAQNWHDWAAKLGMAGRIWSAGRRCENPDLHQMIR